MGKPNYDISRQEKYNAIIDTFIDNFDRTKFLNAACDYIFGCNYGDIKTKLELLSLYQETLKGKEKPIEKLDYYYNILEYLETSEEKNLFNMLNKIKKKDLKRALEKDFVYAGIVNQDNNSTTEGILE